MEPQYNEGPWDGQSLFAITRFRYIEVDFQVFYYSWAKENRSLYLITFHHSTTEKMIAKTLDLVSFTFSRTRLEGNK